MCEGWPEPSDADIERFMDLVDILPNGCWYWMGARSRGKESKKAQRKKKWYGTFWYQGRRVRAHAFSYHFLGMDGRGLPLRRFLPPGHDRDHNCVFSMCVCPDHIDAVTKVENQTRKWERLKAKKNPMRVIESPSNQV